MRGRGRRSGRPVHVAWLVVPEGAALHARAVPASGRVRGGVCAHRRLSVDPPGCRAPSGRLGRFASDALSRSARGCSRRLTPRTPLPARGFTPSPDLRSTAPTTATGTSAVRPTTSSGATCARSRKAVREDWEARRRREAIRPPRLRRGAAEPRPPRARPAAPHRRALLPRATRARGLRARLRAPRPNAALRYDEPEVQQARRDALAWWIPLLGDVLVCLTTFAIDASLCAGAITVARDPASSRMTRSARCFPAPSSRPTCSVPWRAARAGHRALRGRPLARRALRLGLAGYDPRADDLRDPGGGDGDGPGGSARCARVRHADERADDGRLAGRFVHLRRGRPLAWQLDGSP